MGYKADVGTVRVESRITRSRLYTKGVRTKWQLAGILGFSVLFFISVFGLILSGDALAQSATYDADRVKFDDGDDLQEKFDAGGLGGGVGGAVGDSGSPTTADPIAIGGGTGITTSSNAAGMAITLDDTGVTPGEYTNPTITIDAQGRVVAAGDGSSGGGSGFVLNDCQEATSGATCVERSTGVEYLAVGNAIVPVEGVSHRYGLNATETEGILTADGEIGITNQWSMAAQIKLDELPPNGFSRGLFYLRKIGSADVVDCRIRGSSDDGAYVHCEVYDLAGVKFKDFTWRVSLQANEFISLALTFDGDAPGDPLRLFYQGGEWQKTFANAGYLDGTGTMDDPGGRSFRFFYAGASNGLDGTYYQSGIWDRPLTVREIAEIHNGGAGFDWRAFAPLHYFKYCADGEITPANLGTGTLPGWGAVQGTPTCKRETFSIFPDDELIRGRLEVVAFGDSRTNAPGAWPKSDRTPLKFIRRDYLGDNEGVGGETCAEIHSRLTEYLEGTPTAGAVIVNCGANDAADTGFDVASTVNELVSMVSEIEAAGLDAFVVATEPVLLQGANGGNPRAANVDALVAAVRSESGLSGRVCDLHGYLRSAYPSEEDLVSIYSTGDAVHLDHDLGHPVVASVFDDCLGPPENY